jgi:hypothetical protein
MTIDGTEATFPFDRKTTRSRLVCALRLGEKGCCDDAHVVLGWVDGDDQETWLVYCRLFDGLFGEKLIVRAGCEDADCRSLLRPFVEEAK